MSPLDFPLNPFDGQRYTSAGVTYIYNSAIAAWVTDLIQVMPDANTVNTQVWFNDDGAANGSYGLTFNRRSNVFTTNTSIAYSVTTDQITVSSGGTLNNIEFRGEINTANANLKTVVLTDAANINWDASAGPVASVTLGGNRTFNAPTNLRVATYILHIYQDGTGNRTLTWNSRFKWPAGATPQLSVAAGAHDVISFASDGTYLYGSILPDVK